MIAGNAPIEGVLMGYHKRATASIANGQINGAQTTMRPNAELTGRNKRSLRRSALNHQC